MRQSIPGIMLIEITCRTWGRP